LTFLMPLLRQAGIEYEAIEIDRLTDRPEIIDLIALTRALCHEGDRLAWLSLLRGPWCGLRWLDLHTLVSNDYRQTVLELYRTPERFSSLSDEGQDLLNRLMTTLEPYLISNRTLSLREKVERTWCQLGGPAWLQDESQLENAYMYLEMLDELDFAGTLHDIVEFEERLQIQRVSSTVGADCRVQLMTMHKAKGLQFDHVILHALGRRPRGDRKEVLTWLNLPEGGIQNRLVISPIGRKGSPDDDPLYRFIHRTDQEKTKMELDRLLYVACTRAKNSLHLVGSVKVSSDDQISEPENNSLLKCLWPTVSGQYQEAFKNLESTEEIDDRQTKNEGILCMPILHRLSPSWQKPLPPEPEFLVGRDQSPNIENDRLVEYYWVGGVARNAGTIVHRWLHRLTEETTDIASVNFEEVGRVSRCWAETMGVVDSQVADICQRTDEAIRNILEDPKGRWLLEGEGASELAVSGILEGRVESIIIDRVRIDDDGTHWIVDYKTSSHEGGNLEGFLGQEAERYRPQLQKYATIYKNLTRAKVRTALYFPLLREFYEVEIQA